MKHSTKSVSGMKRSIDHAWLRLVSAANGDSRAHRLLAEAFETAHKQERQHRAIGARFTHGQASYRLPAHYAAKAIIINHFCLGNKKPRSWAEVMSFRHDCALAYAVREILDETHPGLVAECAEAGSIDYAEDIAS